MYLRRLYPYKHFPFVRQYVMKPPNILIRIKRGSDFKHYQNAIRSVIKQDRYTIYSLDDDKFYKQPWYDACVLLLFEYTHPFSPTNQEIKLLRNYINNCDGKILFLGDAVDEDISCFIESLSLDITKIDPASIDGVETCERKHTFIASCSTKFAELPLNHISDIIESLRIETGKSVTLNPSSPAFFFSIDSNISVNQIFNLEGVQNKIGGDKQEIHIEGLQVIGSNKVDVVTDSGDIKHSTFNWKLYKSLTKTKYYGKHLIFKNILASTQDFFTRVNVNAVKVDGLVVTAAQQTQGKGRSNNQWLSPRGCMMFSTQISIPYQSALGQRLPFIQHIIVVAFIRAIKERKGYEKLDLNIKWPNDIYIKRSIKIGGVIVNSSLFDGMFKIVIGLGVNISNEEPTECLNSLIRDHNHEYATSLQEICIEDTLASTINKLESLVDLFQKDGVETFKEEYYSCWMHDNVEVTLDFENNAKARITGLDDFGFLVVKVDDGRELCLQPDGNSFDMMKNMISLKK